MDTYLFVHFVGTQDSEDDEQVYFSISKDGKNWHTLNGGKPFLKSDVGEKGVRDPYITRSPETGKYYVFGTDLSIYYRKLIGDQMEQWLRCQNRRPDNPNPGSQSIVVWESNDLVHWSDARLAKVAPDDGGCYWAPECIWDKEKKAFMVFGASRTARRDYDVLQIFRSYTRDFRNFTPAELYMDESSDLSTGEPMHVFDTTITEHNGKYFRIYKTDRIRIDMADSLDGVWQKVNTNIHEIASCHEGPTICRLIDSGKWCLMLDALSEPSGYHPFVTDDLALGQFYPSQEIVLPKNVKFRHGTLTRITFGEYERLKNYEINAG